MHPRSILLLMLLLQGAAASENAKADLAMGTVAPISQRAVSASVSVYLPAERTDRPIDGLMILLTDRVDIQAADLLQPFISAVLDPQHVAAVLVMVPPGTRKTPLPRLATQIASAIKECAPTLRAPMDRCSVITIGATDAILGQWLTKAPGRNGDFAIAHATLVAPAGQGPSLPKDMTQACTILLRRDDWIDNIDNRGVTGLQRAMEAFASADVTVDRSFRLLPVAPEQELTAIAAMVARQYRRCRQLLPPPQPPMSTSGDRQLWKLLTSRTPTSARTAMARAPALGSPAIRQLVTTILQEREQTLLELIEREPALANAHLALIGDHPRDQLADLCDSPVLAGRLRDPSVLANLDLAARFLGTVQAEFACIFRRPPRVNINRRGLVAEARRVMGPQSDSGQACEEWLSVR